MTEQENKPQRSETEGADGKQKRPRRKESPEEKAARLAVERERVLRGVAENVTDDARSQVAYILSHFPDARGSDTTLAIRLWKTFYPDVLDGDLLATSDLYHLPAATSITRARAKIQNDYGLYRPAGDVVDARRQRRKDVAAEIKADKPGRLGLSVYADESGRTSRFLVVGGAWIVDPSRLYRIDSALREFKKTSGIQGELKFEKLSWGNLENAKAFVEASLAHSGLLGLKACALDTSKVKGKSKEETLYGLYYEMIMAGVEHEVERGRATLPRALAIVKDEADADALELPELERRLATACREHFGEEIEIDGVTALKSHDSPLLQLADLFVGSISRVLNKMGDSENQKDAFAADLERIAGFSFAAAVQGVPAGDFVYVRVLGALSHVQPPGSGAAPAGVGLPR